MKSNRIILCALTLSMLSNFKISMGHCDTMEGPVIVDAKKAIDQKNVNYVLKWVPSENEKEVKYAFDLAMNVRKLNPQARELSDTYFFETLVRIHRNSEGVPYSGIKPYGTPVDEKIKAADESILAGNLAPLERFVPEDKLPELKNRFNKVILSRDFDVNDVEAGREYIEAYVQFFHFAEGEEQGHGHEVIEKTGHLGHIPWILSGIFFITSILLGVRLYRFTHPGSA